MKPMTIAATDTKYVAAISPRILDAWSRPDIPLHSLSMLKIPRQGIIPDKESEIGPIKMINELKQK